MRQKLFKPGLCILFSLCLQPAMADSDFWKDVSQRSAKTNAQTSLKLLPRTFRLLQLDEAAIRRHLSTAQRSTVNRTIDVPLPEGDFLTLEITETVMMEEGLANKFPHIKTYEVNAVGRPGISGSADMTEQGFRSMLFMEDGRRLFIDTRDDDSGERYYISYYDADYHPGEKAPHKCAVHTESGAQRFQQSFSPARILAQRSGTDIRTYRLAVSASGEYTQFHGGSTRAALSSVVTSINRVNQIYQRDLAIKMVLVADNDELIYPNANTDPFSGNDLNMLIQNQSSTDAKIGSENYDIGHVVLAGGGGGIASLESVCQTGFKAEGLSGSDQPVNDPFDIDYLAHEIGHQFGANHSFNATAGGCNRNRQTAWEPGSGVTIMGYAGVCNAEDDVQSTSNAMFHIGNIQQMSSYINSSSGAGACGSPENTGNSQPQAIAGADYTIPARTPFELIGSGTDADGDTLTYSWEQMDIGRAGGLDTDTGGPLFRTFLPQGSPVRTFPQLSDILADTQTPGEILPTRTRDMSFTLAVRDQRGGVDADQVVIAAHDTGSAFKVTSQGSGQTLSTGDAIPVSWDIAGTTASPINCASVDITLTTNGGVSFDTVLAVGTANDGSETITIPNNTPDSSNGRIKVKCSDNIFFDISGADLTLNGIDNPVPESEQSGSNDRVQQIYIAYYGRPGDPAGVNFWVDALNSNGGNLDAIIGRFGNSEEYTERFSGLNNSSLINNIYQALLNRSADASGLNYYLGRLSNGSNLSEIALQILDGARENDKTVIANKVEIANYFTEQVERSGKSYGTEDLTFVAELLSTITALTASVGAARVEVDNWIQ